jgi:pyrimidine deaminase RibD-like protein
LREAGETVQAGGIYAELSTLPDEITNWDRLEDYHDLTREAALQVKAILIACVQGRDLDRKFMERAVEAARKSASEDDRVHPNVGVVVVKNGKELATAHRGEMAPGDHAEFTALEKKLLGDVVAGATVYTTLEPCTTRKHPKWPCADRLIERRVKRVVIGMLDPNPEIRGKGYQRLRNANIGVDLFDDDLKAEIEEMNREFTRHHDRPLPRQTEGNA